MKKRTHVSAGKIWYHPSVLQLMHDGYPGERPEDRILVNARNRVDEGIRQGWLGPPFNPSSLAHLLGIKPIAIEGIEAEAQIVPKNGQFELHFRTDVTDKRLNFTFCHEIAHTLFPDCATMIHQRNTSRSRFDPEREVEYLCDIGASQILMPPPYFDEDLKKQGFSLRSVDSLSETYKASREAIIRRIPSTNLEPSAVVYLELGLNKKELASVQNLGLPFPGMKVPRQKLRVRRVYPSKDFLVFLPYNKSIPDMSAVYQILQGKEYVSTIEHWDIDDFGRKRIEAIRLYDNLKNGNITIVALVH